MPRTREKTVAGERALARAGGPLRPHARQGPRRAARPPSQTERGGPAATATGSRSPALFHSPSDLEKALGERIAGARPLFQGADTMVLRVETASGARWVYKGQWGAPHEVRFYRQARSPLLPQCQVLLEEPERSALLLEYVDAPNLCQRRPAEDEAAALARDLTHRIQEIQGDPPVVERLDSAERWREFQARTIERVRLLGERRLTRPVAESVLGELARIAAQSHVEDALAGGIGLMHSDLHAENVFVLPQGGWKVVDWQRPRTGPQAVDTALLLETLGFNPLGHVPAAAVLLMHFLRMGDCASCLWDAGWDPGGAAERHLLFRISGVFAVSPSARDTAQRRAPPL